MIKKKLTKKKKIILIIVAVLLVALVIFKLAMPKQTEDDALDVELIEKRDIAQSISATGVIKTEDTKNVVSTLTGLKIKTVDVKVGQKISAGDVICTFDTSDLQDSLAQVQTSLNATKAQSTLGVQSAQRSLNEAITNKDTQVNSSKADVDSAEKAYKNAQNSLSSAQSALSTAQTQVKNYENQYKIALANYEPIEKEYNNRAKAYVDAQNAYEAQKIVFQNAETEYKKYYNENGTAIADENEAVKQNYLDAKSKLSSLETEMNTANNNYTNYKSTYESALSTYTPINTAYQDLVAAVSTQQANVANLQSQVDSLKQTYDKTVQAYNQTISSADSTIASMQDNLTNSELSSSISTQSQESQIKAYNEQISDGIVTSTVSGTVTSVSVKVGDIYTGSVIAVIEGCEDFIVESEIDEYDIADVEVGMKVLIKTDATRDEELEGRVIYTAPSATTSQTALTTSSSATYTVKIELDTPNDRLRLGMNAKLSIITESKENVWSVPYDAVYDRDDGTSYIEILKNEETEETEEVDVKRGLEGTYYVEIISSKLKEGMKVVLPKLEAGTSLESLLEAMGADAGL
jgi:multidrug efflux pump subunit AcrA (membrane-fusion protein)